MRLPRSLIPGLLVAVASCRAPEPSVDPVLGPELIVNGTVVPSMEVKRTIVTGPLGRALLEGAKLQVFLDQELERRAQTGSSLDPPRVSDEEVAAEVAAQEAERERTAPLVATHDLGDVPGPIVEAEVRRKLLFDRIFLPDDARDYPPKTVTALKRQAKDFVDRLIEGHEARQCIAAEKREEMTTKRRRGDELMAEAGRDPGKVAAARKLLDEAEAAQGELNAMGSDEGRLLFRQLMHELILTALERSAEIRTALDGLPPEVTLEVNGVPVSTAELWARIRDQVTPQHVRNAKLWLAKTILLRSLLKASGHYVSDHEFELLYRQHVDPYKDSPFSIPVVAVSFKKFPSEQAYREHYRLRESFRNRIATELDDDILCAHNEARTKLLLGPGMIEVEVILISTAEEGGWGFARSRVIEVVQALTDGRPWAEVLDEYSDFGEDRSRGRFGWMNRDELMPRLGESFYSLFLSGESLTDKLFLDAGIGVPTQPFLGAEGYYVCLVKDRDGPWTAIELPRHRNLVEHDYLTCRFNAFAREALAGADVQGLDAGAGE